MSACSFADGPVDSRPARYRGTLSCRVLDRIAGDFFGSRATPMAGSDPSARGRAA